MTRGMAVRLTGAALALLVLAGCGGAGAPGASEGPGAEGPTRGERALALVGSARRVLGGVSSPGLGLPRPVPAFTPEAVAADPGAFRVVQVNALGLQETARVVEANARATTLALQSGPTALFVDGVLVGTRGFGDDLLTLESTGVLAALRAGGGTLQRRMERLDGQDRVVTDAFACTVTAAGVEDVNLGVREVAARRLDEACRGSRIGFDNIYWLDAAGEILASRQYVSPTVAYLRSNRL